MAQVMEQAKSGMGSALETAAFGANSAAARPEARELEALVSQLVNGVAFQAEACKKGCHGGNHQSKPS